MGYPRNPVTLGDHLKKRRLDLRLYQREAAAASGLPADGFQRWERNEVQPTVQFYPRIIEFLGYDPLPPARTLGERLRRVRKRAGLSIRQVANYLGVDSGSLSRWETESKVPYSHHLQLLEAFLQNFENADEGALAEAIRSLNGGEMKSFDHPLRPETPRTLGQLLLRKRMELGLSQTEVGKQLKVGRGAIWNWETDSALPHHLYMAPVIRFLECVPWPEQPGRRIQVCRLALGLDCIAFERRFKVWRRILSPVELGRADPPEGLAERLETLLANRFPASKFPRVKIADLALRTRRGGRRGAKL